MSAVRWGMLSTSGIGRVVAAAIATSPHAELVAVASRDVAKARAFADELGVPSSHGSYRELLASEEVDAVYIPLPIALHTEWTVEALAAGKHVLCEKPFALDEVDAARCFDAARTAGRECIEGLMYRHHPQTLLTQALVGDGAIGELAFIRATLSVDVPAGDIRRTTALGGGAILDLGCYCISAVRLFGGEPETVFAARTLDPAPGAENADLRLAATLQLRSGVLAQFDVGLDYPRRDELELIGTAGKIVVPDPWLCRPGYIELEREGMTERLPVDPDGKYSLSSAEENDDAYRIEFEAASQAISTGSAPGFGRDDAVAQAAALAAVRRSAETRVPVRLSPSPERYVLT
jgi:xylose dehydrogenase (NAD/NADP)